MGYDINWSIGPNDPVLDSPLYQKWSVKSLGTIASEMADLKNDLGTCVMNKESTAISSYLAWLIRTALLVSG